MIPAPDNKPRLLAGTAAFIKDHLIPVNTVIAFSALMVGNSPTSTVIAPRATTLQHLT